MSQFEKDSNLMNGKGEDDIQWITVNGSHIPLKDGENPKQAIKNRFDDKIKPNDKPLINQVDEVLDGKFKGTHIVLSEDTPKVLQDIGVPNKPMLMTKKHTYLAIKDSGIYTDANDHYHNLGKDLFMQIPNLLKSPVLVFQNKEDIVAVINAVDKQGNPVIVPIQINGKGTQNYIRVESNIVKSAYGKNNLNNYISNNVRSEDILLIENKKIRDLNTKGSNH